MSGYAVGHVLRTSRATGTTLLVLIVIAEATHQDGTGAWPAVASIAQLARTTERSVRRVLRSLEAAGELLVERNAGPRGTNLYAIPGVGQVRLGEDAGVTPDTLSGGHRRRRPRTTAAGTPDNRDRTPDTAVSPEPSLEPSIDPSDEPSARDARATGVEIPTRPQTVREIEREHNLFGKLAEEVWLEIAAKVGSMYTDRSALRLVHQHAIAALSFGTELQILEAMRRRVTRQTTPRRISELTRLEVGQQRAEAHARGAREEHDEIIEGPRVAGVRHIGGGLARATQLAAGKMAAAS